MILLIASIDKISIQCVSLNMVIFVLTRRSLYEGTKYACHYDRRLINNEILNMECLQNVDVLYTGQGTNYRKKTQ